jgi:hypothetical protein
MIANPIPWPDGARCAVAMTWDMDADSAFNWYNKDTADTLVAAQSWTRYDPLIAIPRLVESPPLLSAVRGLGFPHGSHPASERSGQNGWASSTGEPSWPGRHTIKS